jgi:lipoprotein-anchoring transpeptidase ErfK/SrfK
MNPKHVALHTRAFLKFWVFVLAVSFAGLWYFSSRDSAESEPVVIESGSPEDFSTLVPPRVRETIPAKGTSNVLIGIEDPIIVRFTDSVKPYHIRFDLEPQVELLFENNPEKTEFRILPKEPLRDGVQYALRLSYTLRETPDAVYRPFFETAFTTSVPQPIVLANEKKAEEPVAAVPKRVEGKYIDIDIAQQRMTLFQDGRAIQSHLISSGKRGMDTPKGEFSIHNKAPRPWSKTYGLYMPYWMAITADGKFGIHELPEWPSGYKEGANHLGHPVSHGCVRLGVGNAREVYDWTDTGTVVIVH